MSTKAVKKNGKKEQSHVEIVAQVVGQNDASYQEMDKNDHIKIRPEMYVGTMSAISRDVALVGPDKVQIYETMDLSPGLLRILIELICNAMDNIFESRKAGIRPGRLYIKCDGESITVVNEGRAMPVKKMKRSDGVLDWVPSVMFSRMFASSHYAETEDRDTAGMYGVGAKMCNALSLTFSIVVRDGTNELRQTWHSMEGDEPIITPSTESPLVSITFVPDMSKFPGSVRLQENPNLLRKMAADAALFSRVPVEFSCITKDGRASQEENCTFDFSCSVLPAMKMRGAINVISHTTHQHRIWLFSRKDHSLVQESYVNGTPTYTHGKHVDSLFKVLKEAIKTKKGFDQVDKRHLMGRLSFVICSTINKPLFDGACKDKLTSKVDDWVWPDLLKEMDSKLPDVMESIKRSLDNAEYKALHGKKTKMTGYWPASSKGRGGRRRRLWITEGISAARYVMDIIMALYGDRSRDAVLAIRGKTLNVRNNTAKTIAGNKVIEMIVRAMGLQIGLDYSKKENVDTLLIDEVVIASDSDGDGMHIRALLVDLIEQFAPALLHAEKPFVYIMESPVVRVQYRGEQLRFYRERDWEEWQKTHKTGWTKNGVHYCKGLGSSGPGEAEEDAEAGEDTILRRIRYTEGSDIALQLAFDDELSDMRKEWLLGDLALETTDEKDYTPIPNMVQKELRDHSLVTLERAIPKIDCFTSSTRMLMWIALCHGKMKSDALLGKILETLNYKHGPTSLYGALVGMVAGYPGSNNLPLFNPSGNFGSRSFLGKNAAASRYTEASLRPYVSSIFRDEDLPILQYKVENGVTYEPLYLLPIIPLTYANGVAGIATGWSTFIPSYNPEAVIESLETLASGGTLSPDTLVPWYRHFKGKVAFKTIRDDQEEVDEDGNVWKVRKGEQAIRVTGRKSTVTKDGKKTITINEIPVYVGTKAFVEDLETLMEDNKQPEPKDNSGNNTVNIELNLKQGVSFTDKELKLTVTRSLSNMYIIGTDGVPVHFNTPEEGITYFYNWRIQWYTLRKESQLATLDKKIEAEENYHTFLTAVLDGIFDPRPGPHIKTRATYLEWLERNGYTAASAERYKVYHTKEVLEEVEKKIETLKEERETIASCREEDMYLSDLADLREAIHKYYTGPDAEIDLLDPAARKKRGGKKK